ncbi:MAG: DUF2974 domain-containing protein [Streptococcaceae bacterium]|jgi:hypothetical protein|nr:DUF2974 domain-containing protein [Streptococcaceae bacterium]MCH4176925.1 DUF2974 domain-containing protein [Streptococcaceae bacterium]
MSHLSEDQLAQLNVLIYQMSGTYPDGMTVNQIAQEMLKNQVRIEKYSVAESKAFFQALCNDKQLSRYYIQRFDQNAGVRNACFTDDLFLPTDVNVIFRGTGNADEWRDNGEGGYLSDSECQRAAATYITQLPKNFGNSMTVSGHSKGGNKAQYATIITDRIERCISFDGQGFSKQFLEKYALEIKAKKNRISSISAANDYVNILFYPIAARQVYIDTEQFADFTDYHYPEIILEANHLRPTTVQNGRLKVIGEYTQWLQETPQLSKQAKKQIYLSLTQVIAKRGKNLSMTAWLDAVLSISDLSIGYFDNFMRDKLSRTNPNYKLLLAISVQLLDYRPQKYQILRQIYNQLQLKEINASGTVKKKSVDNQTMNNYIDQLIRIDTAELRSVALSLQSLSDRIAQLYYREQTLLRKMVAEKEFNQISNSKLDYQASSALSSIAGYLMETATNFEKIEHIIQGG